MFVPENDGTLIRNNKESSVQITLRLAGECIPENASAIARMAKTVVGNETTEIFCIRAETIRLLPDMQQARFH